MTALLEAGTRLGPYEILALIGVGGMGEVYRAALSHENILSIHDIGGEGGVVYLVMELLTGETLLRTRIALPNDARSRTSVAVRHGG